MKLNEKVKHVTCGIVVGAMLTTTFPAAAAQMTKNISATYNNIKIIVDGQQVNTGSAREPFIYNGTTYLPIRAVGEAVGKKVTWDGKTHTVYLGDNPVSSNKEYLLDVCYPYQGSYMYDSVKMAGQTYLKAMSAGDIDILVNLNGRYKTLEFDFGHIDGKQTHEGIYNIYVDGVLVKNITATSDMLPEHYVIPLNYGLQLRIESVNDWKGTVYAMANCTLE